MKVKKNMGVLNFERSHYYYYDKFEKCVEESKYADAVAAIRKACELEPKDPEYKFAMAELYTEMGYFDESNLLLFEMLNNEECEDYKGECLFSMGCNFLGLQEFMRARECFEQYMDLDDDDEYEFEVEEILDMIDSNEFVGVSPFIFDMNKEKVNEAARHGRELLDSGEYFEAINVLTKVLKENPSALFIKNNLALAHFCKGDVEMALKLTDDVLKRSSLNIHANCNKALFLAGNSDIDRLHTHLKKMDALSPKDMDEATKLALTLCELKQHDRVLRVTRQILRERPYDTKLMFINAIACVNLGRMQDAVTKFADIIKIDPDNTIACYYNNMVKQAKAEGRSLTLNYIIQVPLQEIRNRIAYLNECFQLPKDKLLNMWQNDKRFYSIMMWGMSLDDLLTKRIIVDVISSFKDDKAIKALKRFILMKNEPDEVKHEVFIKLREMGEREPYLAYMGQKFSEVRLGMMSIPNDKMKNSHTKVLMVLTDHAHRKPSLYLQKAIEIWGGYIKLVNLGGVRKYNNWAAAIEGCAAMMLGEEPDYNEIADEYEVNKDDVKKIARKIFKNLKKEKENS